MNFYEEQLINKFTVERKFTHKPGYSFPWQRDSADRQILIIEFGEGIKQTGIKEKIISLLTCIS